MAKIDVWRTRCRYGLSVFYGVAGILHIVFPAPFLTITPRWVPDASDVIFLTGCCEIAGAIGLLIPATRRYAGAGLAVYAVCVFPANVKHAVDSLGGTVISPWPWLYHIPRLALQPVIAWAAFFSVGSATWPLRRVP